MLYNLIIEHWKWQKYLLLYMRVFGRKKLGTNLPSPPRWNLEYLFLSAVPGITLTYFPPPSSNGYFCPGPVQFTCVGTEIPKLGWKINGTYRGRYQYFHDDTFPQSLSLSPLLPDVNIMITSGSDSRIESTLNANVSSLRETLIECNNVQYESNTTVQERQGIRYSKNVQNRDLLP